jgi:hypothetical protein
MEIRRSFFYLCFALLPLSGTCLRAQDMPLSQVLIPGEEWKKVGGKFKSIWALSSVSGKTPLLFLYDDTNKLQAILDRNDKARADVHEEAITPLRFHAHASTGFAYTIRPKEQVVTVHPINDPDKSLKEIKLPITEASAWALTRDMGSVLITGAASKHVWMFRLDADGGFSGGEKYMTLRVRKDDLRSEASAICLDHAGRFFAATKFGVQVFDPTGRLCGVLLNPSSQRPTAMTFGGENGDLLYLACGTELYSRRLQEKRAEYPFLKAK